MSSEQGAACCRNALESLPLDGRTTGPANPGLLLDRYLRRQGDQGAARRGILEAASGSAARVAGLYREAFTRFAASLPQTAVTQHFGVDGRLAVGLGVVSPLEVGLRLHPTYGTPVIPGSGLKGLAAHYCAEVWGRLDPRFGDEYHKLLFGSTDDAGRAVFYDALITPETLPGSLIPDVITVHHPDYYSGKAGAAPTDCDQPNPVPFLSVTGTFFLAVDVEDPSPAGREWARLVMALLADALSEWGVGGKTSAGYGRMFPVEGPGPATTERPPTPAARKAAPALSPGAVVRVRCVPDPKGRGRPWFQLVDGGGEGTVLQEGTPRDVKVGDELELGIASISNTINFVWPDSPRLQRKETRPGQAGAGRPQGRRR